MRPPAPKSLRFASLAAATLLLPACIEADVQTEIRDDGSGTFGMSMKFTEKFVEVMRKMEKLDPSKAGELNMAMKGMPTKPDDATVAELEKAGLKVLECDAVNSEKELSARVKVEFRDLAALELMDRLEKKEAGKKSKGGPGDDVMLTRDEKGLYTLSVSLESNAAVGGGDSEMSEDSDEDGGMAGPGGEGGEAKPEEDPEEAAKKMQEAMAMMGELMGEATKLKFVVGLKVPGEVVEYSPKAGAKAEAGKVTWTLDFSTMMQMQMESSMQQQEEGGGKGMAYRVVFKMAEGKSLPESALRKPKAAEPKAEPAPAPAPAGPEGPPSPLPPAPGGEK